MLDVPDKLTFLTDPIRVERGNTASFGLAINAKNGFLPRYAEGLSIVFGPELAGQATVISRGSLRGGRVRILLETTPDTPIVTSTVRVALVVPELGLLLTNEGTMEIREPQEDRRRQRDLGGQPDIRVLWVSREKWDQFEPPWDAETVGNCDIYRNDPAAPKAINKVEFVLNEAFLPFERVIAQKRIGEQQMKSFRDGYAYPVLFALFRQRLAEERRRAKPMRKASSSTSLRTM